MSKLCYNRGCGKTFDPANNTDDACLYHSGNPVFHDAYKSWSCCGKKTTDFSEFLSTKGCTRGKHSNVKVVEPESITGRLNKDSPSEEVVEVRPSVTRSTGERPDFDSKMVRLKPIITDSLKKQLESLTASKVTADTSSGGVVAEGETCKNGGCKVTHKSGIDEKCVHHPGVPVFHEGMKYWSCCQRKTTDFHMFLEQEGCETGAHKWLKENEGNAEVECRYDWHQTGTHVTISVYAKKYDPILSCVEVNPIRCRIHLCFKEQGGSFNMDLELRGIINVEETTLTMLGTKVEIKMKKNEAGSWAKLDFPRPQKQHVQDEDKVSVLSKNDSQVDALDLDDLDIVPQKPLTLSKEASGGRSDKEIV